MDCGVSWKCKKEKEARVGKCFGISSCEGEWSRGKRRNAGLLCINGRGRSMKWEKDINKIAPDLVCSHTYKRRSYQLGRDLIP